MLLVFTDEFCTQDHRRKVNMLMHVLQQLLQMFFPGFIKYNMMRTMQKQEEFLGLTKCFNRSGLELLRCRFETTNLFLFF